MVFRAAQGLVIVRLDNDDASDIGTMVLDEPLPMVDRIVDVFGPIDHPCITVTADSGSPARFVGNKLYAR